MEFVKCSLCNDERYEKLYLTSVGYFPTGEKFQLVRCLTCGLVYINPRPSPQEIERYYPPEYYLIIKEPSYIQLLQVNKASIVERFKKGGRLLELGCGLGFFLAKMEKRGWEVYGVDFSPAVCEYAKNRLGLKNIYNQDIYSLNLSYGFFDVIVILHTIEHLHNPLEVIMKAKRLLKEDGILIVTCPNFSSLERKIFKNNWYMLDVPRHLFQFTPESLKKILKICGFEIAGVSCRFSTDPYLNVINFKKTLLHWLGLDKLAISRRAVSDTLGKLRNRKFIWRLLSFSFNLFCFFLSLILGVLGRGDGLLVCAKKKAE